MRRTIRAAATLCAASTMMLAACSSSSTGASSGGSSSAPIVVGYIGSQTGVFQQTFGLGSSVIQAWADSVNASGGLNGHKVKVIVTDDGGDAATALTDAKKLVADHVVAVVGIGTGVLTGWPTYLEQQGIPIVGGYSANDSFLNSPDAFAIGMTSDYFSFATIGELDAQGGTSKLGLAYCAEATVCNLSSNLTKSIKVLGSSAQLVKSVSIAATQPNFTAACLTLKQAGVDNLNVSDQGDIIQKMVSDCAQQGYRPKNTDVFTGYTSKWLTDPNMDGTVIVSPNAYWGDSSVPGAVQYMAALKKYAPSAASSPNLYLAEFQTWLGGQLFAAAAKVGKIGPDSTPQDVKNALLSLKGETLGGAAPPLTFSKSSPTRVPCWFAYKVGSGALQALNGSKPICATSAQSAAFQAAEG